MARVLITGGAGFIGSALSARFVRGGYDVTVLDSLSEQIHGPRPQTTSSLFQSLADEVRFVRGDVTRAEDLRDALTGASIVVHLAAETGTGQSMYEIDRYTTVNVGGTSKLLDILANEQHDVTRMLVASSRSIYGEGAYRNPAGEVVYPGHRNAAALDKGDFDVHVAPGDNLSVIPTDESATLHPSSVYGITKQMQEALVMTVCSAIGMEAVALRYQNVYGPGQSLRNPYTGILSIFSTLIREGKSINVFEDGEESRDFVYIADVVEATYRAATVPGATGHVLNVGSGVRTSVTQVVEGLIREFGVDVPVRVSGNYRLGDIRHNFADLTKMRHLLGEWELTTFDRGLSEFVRWVMTQEVSADGYERSLREMADRNLLK